MITDEQRVKFLTQLILKTYPQTLTAFANKSKKGNWSFGFDNDKPLQHGKGVNCCLPESIVDQLILTNLK